MKIEIAIKVVAKYKSDKEKAEKNRTGILWINPVFDKNHVFIPCLYY